MRQFVSMMWRNPWALCGGMMLCLITTGMVAAQEDTSSVFDDPAGATSADPFDLGTGGDLGGGGGLGGATDPSQDPRMEMQRLSESAEQKMTEGKWDEAVADFNGIIAIDSTFAPAYFGRGQCFKEMGLKNEAIESYSRAIASPYAARYGGLVPQAYQERALLYLDTGRYREASDDAMQAMSLDPTNADAFYLHGKATLRQVLTSPGQGMDQSGQRSLIQAIGSIERAIEIRSDFGEAYLERGRIEARMREVDFAITDLQRAVQLIGEGTMASADLGLAYIQRATIEGSRINGDQNQIVSDLRAAITAFSDFVRNNPVTGPTKPWESSDPTDSNATSIILSRAEAMNSLGDEVGGEEAEANYRSAIADCDSVLARDSATVDQARAHFNRGVSLRMLNDIPGAIEAFTEAIRKFPSYSEAHLRRGICLFHQQKYDMALQDFDAASVDPRNPFTVMPESRAALWIGLTHAQRGDHEQAIRAYTRALTGFRGYVTAYLNRGLSYMNLGRYDQAVEDFANVLRLDPDNEDAKRYLALAQAR